MISDALQFCANLTTISQGMKILFCVEFYYPSVGGAQEVVKQIATRMVRKGHHVTVATARLDSRTNFDINGVKIVEFDVSGNLARGLYGEIDQYQKFVLNGGFHSIFIYAAQQWTFDALLDVLPRIHARKVFVPCGFSGLYEESYQEYFARLPRYLMEFDALVFHARNYRDAQYAANHGLSKLYLVPNGASEEEFAVAPDLTGFREKCGIASDAFVILTVGSLNGEKGHQELAQALALLKTSKPVHVILNGNRITRTEPPDDQQSGGWWAMPRKGMKTLRKWVGACLRALGLRAKLAETLDQYVRQINRGKYGKNKRALIADLPRAELLRAYFDAQLFVFASKIEYSPLVLFEAAAAGLPGLSVPVGNTDEIVQWTRGAWICPAKKDERGHTKTDPAVLAEKIDALIEDVAARQTLAREGRGRWEQYFTWQVLSDAYEKLLVGRDMEDAELANKMAFE